jgi:hypothetical protein
LTHSQVAWKDKKYFNKLGLGLFKIIILSYASGIKVNQDYELEMMRKEGREREICAVLRCSYLLRLYRGGDTSI